MCLVRTNRFLQLLPESGPWWWGYDTFCIGGGCVGAAHCAHKHGTGLGYASVICMSSPFCFRLTHQVSSPAALSAQWTYDLTLNYFGIMHVWIFRGWCIENRLSIWCMNPAAGSALIVFIRSDKGSLVTCEHGNYARYRAGDQRPKTFHVVAVRPISTGD